MSFLRQRGAELVELTAPLAMNEATVEPWMSSTPIRAARAAPVMHTAAAKTSGTMGGRCNFNPLE